MCAVMKLDKRNEIIRRTKKLREIFNKVQESRFKWNGHVTRRAYDVNKRMMVVDVPGKIMKGRPERI